MANNKLDTRLQLNFRYVVDAQVRKVSTEKVKQGMGGFARVLMRNVALRTSERFYQSARVIFEKNVQQDVIKEIQQMTKMIQRFLVQPERASGPQGMLVAAQQAVADSSRGLGRTGYFDLGDSDAFWPERNVKYMKKKQEKGYTREWWKGTGALLRQLSKASYLIGKLGPVSVNFTKNKDQKLTATYQTLTGGQGRASENYTVGRLDVVTFGNITPQMLPSLASGNVGDVTPSGYHRIGSLLGGKTGDKLMGMSTSEFGATRQYRPVLEPFVSYYLTRAIPNAVFVRMERQFGRQASGEFASIGKDIGGGRGGSGIVGGRLV